MHVHVLMPADLDLESQAGECLFQSAFVLAAGCHARLYLRSSWEQPVCLLPTFLSAQYPIRALPGSHLVQLTPLQQDHDVARTPACMSPWPRSMH